MLYMKKNFKIKGKIICEQKNFVFILFLISVFPPFLFEWLKCDTNGVYFKTAISKKFVLFES